MNINTRTHNQLRTLYLRPSSQKNTQQTDSPQAPQDSVTLGQGRSSAGSVIGLMVGGILVGGLVGSHGSPVAGCAIMLGSVFGSLAMAAG